ncbi:MAG: phage integrase N-terminal SAM-like domain-containing protein, partial [Methylobacter sp.]
IEVEAFLTYLATQRYVSSSTQNQALSAILFLYREVLTVGLPWLDSFERLKKAAAITCGTYNTGNTSFTE